MIKSKFLKYILVIGVVLVVVVFVYARHSKACCPVPTFDLQNFSKEWVADILVKPIARLILEQVLTSAVNAVRTGDIGGKPAFVRDWREYILQGVERGDKLTRVLVQLSINPPSANQKGMCGFLKGAIKNKFVGSANINTDSYDKFRRKTNDFSEYFYKTQCTLQPETQAKLSDPEGRKQFTRELALGQGGAWDEFRKLYQPQNTYAGVTLFTVDEYIKQTEVAGEADKSEGEASGGFVGLRGGCSTNLFGQKWNDNNPASCLIRKRIKTPGKVHEALTVQSISSQWDWLISADEINELIGIFLASVVGRFTDAGSGLFFGSDPDETFPLADSDQDPSGSGFSQLPPISFTGDDRGRLNPKIKPREPRPGSVKCDVVLSAETSTGQIGTVTCSPPIGSGSTGVDVAPVP